MSFLGGTGEVPGSKMIRFVSLINCSSHSYTSMLFQFTSYTFFGIFNNGDRGAANSGGTLFLVENYSRNTTQQNQA